MLARSARRGLFAAGSPAGLLRASTAATWNPACSGTGEPDGEPACPFFAAPSGFLPPLPAAAASCSHPGLPQPEYSRGRLGRQHAFLVPPRRSGAGVSSYAVPSSQTGGAVQHSWPGPARRRPLPGAEVLSATGFCAPVLARSHESAGKFLSSTGARRSSLLGTVHHGRAPPAKKAVCIHSSAPPPASLLAPFPSELEGGTESPGGRRKHAG